MTNNEINDVINGFSKLDISKLSIEEQTVAMKATIEFAKEVKDIVIRHSSDDELNNFCYLFKL